jgi:hypothetical protein
MAGAAQRPVGLHRASASFSAQALHSGDLFTADYTFRTDQRRLGVSGSSKPCTAQRFKLNVQVDCAMRIEEAFQALHAVLPNFYHWCSSMCHDHQHLPSKAVNNLSPVSECEIGQLQQVCTLVDCTGESIHGAQRLRTLPYIVQSLYCITCDRARVCEGNAASVARSAKAKCSAQQQNLSRSLRA